GGGGGAGGGEGGGVLTTGGLPPDPPPQAASAAQATAAITDPTMGRRRTATLRTSTGDAQRFVRFSDCAVYVILAPEPSSLAHSI
ncbi:hypothetical protein, partial [Erythrobacter sp.]|uniref:hypothetical protein n=1 Tax=Erythrobacter sp. TaxID=1042 RepID=UPI003C74FA9D